MNKKVIYETKWAARDKNKEYPHGWGFDAPLVMFSHDSDPVWCADYCKRYLSDEEFECIGVIPRQLLEMDNEEETEEDMWSRQDTMIPYNKQGEINSDR